MDPAPTSNSSLSDSIGALIVRASVTQYAAEVIGLIEEFYAAIGVQHRDDPAALAAYLADARYGFWVAMIDSSPAGCIVYRPLPEMGNAGELKRMYVRPAYRGRRIADQLLKQAEAFARTQGVESLYLDTHDGLTTAIAFYKGRGFRRCDRYNDNAQATIFMSKQLS